jgi:hypothetical protein
VKKLSVLVLGWSLAAVGSPFSDGAAFLCESVFGQKPYVFADHFDAGFAAQVPEATFRQLVDEIHEASGDCARTQLVSENKDNAVYDLFSARSNKVRVGFSVDSSVKFTALGILGLEMNVPLNTFDDIRAYLAGWRGHASATLSVFGETPLSKDGHDLQPLGSGFKLYVLGALDTAVRMGKAKWSEKLAIKEEWKSLPSGTMHTLPAGSEFPLEEYAKKMISISDNTATDHLIQHLGRANVEAELAPMLNPFELANRPFLLTSELFKLKWGLAPDDTKKFIDADEAQRRALLAKLAAFPLSQVGTNGVSIEKPVYVRELEWFGSTHGLCAAMQSLQARRSQEILNILSANVPFVETGAFKYAGYKGGSEPGVMTMTYLLQGKSGKWGCLSAAWHDENRLINQWLFTDLVKKSLTLASEALK